MRIGIDASPLRVESGGIRRYAESLIGGLTRVAPQNEYVLYGRGLAKRLGAPPAGTAWDPVDFPLKWWLDHLHLIGARSRIDLFHGTNYGAPLLDRTPAVITVHDLTVHLFPDSHPWRRRMGHLLLPLLCRKSARLIADSDNTRRDLIRHYGVDPGHVDVVHLAASERFRRVEDEVELERVRSRYGLPDAFVLFVGSLDPRKNLGTLIEAMAGVRDDGLEHGLVIAGHGEPHEVEALHRAARAARLEPGRDVVFTGFVEDDDLPALYSASDLFVFPSVYEGFGLPPLEAMGCGVPVLLPDNSSFPELYDGCSAMVDLGESGALVRAIRQLLRDTALRGDLIQKGLERARSRSWDDVARETLAVYDRALGL